MNNPEFEADFDDSGRDDPERVCAYCSGTGGDPADDGIIPCPECDGEGYLWYLA